ncbi:hypothetical protein BKA69DRAFT_1175801 [Paraphysoderma sedebokerense]|nr:hypothetical protein BKA69DRAFT_1175801 [Paraphysoderma sedebokerense]
MQHGRKKPTRAQVDAKRLAEISKIKEYQSLCNQALDMRRQAIHNDSSLSITTNLVTLNPDYYTIWNFRREILLSLITATKEVIDSNKTDYMYSAFRIFSSVIHRKLIYSYHRQPLKRLHHELTLLTATITPIAPKSYWVWNHRMWCLEKMAAIIRDQSSHESKPSSSSEDTETLSRPPSLSKLWQGELHLVNKFLDLDTRNFHAWDYRRYVVSQLHSSSVPTDTAKIPPTFQPFSESSVIYVHPLLKAEFEYTMTKISQNFSNFSAWHYRSKLLPRISGLSNNKDDAVVNIIPNGVAQSVETYYGELERIFNDEFELLHSAIYTEPADQSAWLYFRWLLNFKFYELPSLLTSRSDKSNQPAQFTTSGIIKRLQNEINVVAELRDLEPESKWTLLTLVYLLRLFLRIVSSKTEIASAAFEDLKLFDTNPATEASIQSEIKAILAMLEKVDPDRCGYFRDLAKPDKMLSVEGLQGSHSVGSR